MSVRLSYVIAGISFFAAQLSFAEPVELLQPLAVGEEKQVASKNDYFIKRYAYFAKRHRLVRVNTDALLGNESDVVISLFDDAKVSVVRNEIDILDEGTNFTWYGRYSSPPFTVREFIESNAGRSEEVSRRLYNDLFNVTIYGTQYVFDKDPSKAEAVAGMRFDTESKQFVNERDRLSAKLQSGTSIYSAEISLRPWVNLEELHPDQSVYVGDFQIRPLPTDRRFSIVMELDSSKAYPILDDHSKVTPEQEEKVRQYRDFVDSLGEDPTKKRN